MLCQLVQGCFSSLRPLVGLEKCLNTYFYCFRQALIPGTVLDLKLWIFLGQFIIKPLSWYPLNDVMKCCLCHLDIRRPNLSTSHKAFFIFSGKSSFEGECFISEQTIPSCYHQQAIYMKTKCHMTILLPWQNIPV